MIAIIGILVSLLLPAVQAAREAGRRSQCQNNLKQLALGALQHESAKNFLPTGGWWAAWVGDADRGSGRNQPAGWIYCVLPYIEQTTLAQLGAGQPWGSAAKTSAGAQMATTPVASLYCPSRRAIKVYTYGFKGVSKYAVNWDNSQTTSVARSDYAANAGDYGSNDFGAWTPTTIAEGMNAANWPDTSKATGIAFYRSELALAAIKDGTSNTYLFGEKYLNPDSYETGIDFGDNENCYVGWDNDLFRITADTSSSGSVNSYYPPLPDTAGNPTPIPFGSAHAGVFNISFCDGSVQAISYSIDQETHRRLSNRGDGQILDGSKY